MISKRRIEVYPYKMSWDDNGAPSVMDGTLSFAICMRPLRNTAEVDDIIFAFSDLDIKASPFRLLYVWVVKQKLKPIDYYDMPISAGREDNIYERVNRQFERKPLALHHNCCYTGAGTVYHPVYKHTLYRPNYRGVADALPELIQESTKRDWVNRGLANILLSDKYKQFRSVVLPSASDGSDEYKAQFPLVAALIPKIRQMHRTDISSDLRAELLALARLHLPQPGAVPND
jgi:hypothetical protein